MNSKIFVDTNIILYYLNGDKLPFITADKAFRDIEGLETVIYDPSAAA